jgi:F-type H+-transporting ATPase subunit b
LPPKLSLSGRALRQRLQKRFRAAEARISSAKAQALGNVEQIAVDAAASIVEKLTGTTVDKDRLAAEYRTVKSS